MIELSNIYHICCLDLSQSHILVKKKKKVKIMSHPDPIENPVIHNPAVISNILCDSALLFSPTVAKITRFPQRKLSGLVEALDFLARKILNVRNYNCIKCYKSGNVNESFTFTLHMQCFGDENFLNFELLLFHQTAYF